MPEETIGLSSISWWSLWHLVPWLRSWTAIMIPSTWNSKSVRTWLPFWTLRFLFTPETTTPGGLATKVFCKSTDTHALLQKSSFHSKHTFWGIVKSQLFQFQQIFSRTEDFEEATSTLLKALRVRSYARSFLRNIKKEVISLKAPQTTPDGCHSIYLYLLDYHYGCAPPYPRPIPRPSGTAKGIFGLQADHSLQEKP